MRLLGIDTSSPHASVAIVQNGRVVSEKYYNPLTSTVAAAVRARVRHAEILFPLIESALKSAAASLSEISGFAITIGPGSFTGLRIGLSALKGLAYGSNVPIAGISTLHALAARIENFEGVICAILDAQKKEVYAAIFRSNGGFLNRLTDDAVMSFEKLLERLRVCAATEPIVVTGSGAERYGESALRFLGEQVCIRTDATSPTAAAVVALLAEAQVANGVARFPACLAPQYVRLSEAELNASKLS